MKKLNFPSSVDFPVVPYSRCVAEAHVLGAGHGLHELHHLRYRRIDKMIQWTRAHRSNEWKFKKRLLTWSNLSALFE